MPTLIRSAQDRKLIRHIVWVLALKVLLLYGLWKAFFSAPVLPKMTEGMDPGRVAAALVAPGVDPSAPAGGPPDHNRLSSSNSDKAQP